MMKAVAVRDARTGEVVFGVLKVLDLTGDYASYKDLLNATLELVQAWEGYTKKNEVKEYLENVKRAIKIIFELFPEPILDFVPDDYGDDGLSGLLEFLKCIANFEFREAKGALFLGGARFEKIKLEDLLQKGNRDEVIWLDFLYALERYEGVSREEFLSFLKKFEDERFVRVLRSDYQEFLKKVFENA